MNQHQTQEPSYRCSACALAVIVFGDPSKDSLTVIRACRCNATIAATMTTALAGGSRVGVR